jgi:hypothetical protein
VASNAKIIVATAISRIRNDGVRKATGAEIVRHYTGAGEGMEGDGHAPMA